MSAPRADRGQLSTLTGYRFVLAALVLVGHAAFASQIYQEGELQDALAITAPLAFAAVSSFFVLSGFVLTWSAAPGDTLRRFWRRRFWRIYPNHALMWAVTLVLVLVVSAPSMLLGFRDDVSPGSALASLLLVQVWLRVPDYTAALNGASWSIACEAFFYLVFPFILGPIQRIRRERLWAWTLGTAAAVVLIPLPTYLFHGPDYSWWAPLPVTQMWLMYMFPPIRLLEFILGMLLARVVAAGLWPRLRLRWAVLPAVLVTLAAPVIPAAYLLGAALALPFALVIPTLVRRELDGHRSVLQRPLLLALGSASYALYIMHYPLVYAARTAVGAERRFAPLPATAMVLAFIALVIPASWLVYRYWELPLMRRFSRPRPKAGAGAPGAAETPDAADAAGGANVPGRADVPGSTGVRAVAGTSTTTVGAGAAGPAQGTAPREP